MVPTDLRLTFDEVPELYDQVRPQYPQEIFDHIFRQFQDPPHVIDVGPGTGQATNQLLKQASRVTAVEIGANLAKHLKTKYSESNKLDVVNSSIEEAELACNSFDLFFSACAYHWIKDQTGMPARFLKSGGLVAIVDLVQVESETDQGYFKRVQEIYNHYSQTKPDKRLPTAENLIPEIHKKFEADKRYNNLNLHKICWDQTYTASQYADLLRTYSGMITMPETDRENLITELTKVVTNEFNDQVTRPLVVALTTARLVD